MKLYLNYGVEWTSIEKKLNDLSSTVMKVNGTKDPNSYFTF